MAKKPWRLSLKEKFNEIIDKSKSWLKKNTKFSLFIALFGGGPGIVTIYQWWNSDPEFFFFTEAVAFDKTPENIPFIVLGGAIYNDGRSPLFPVWFKIEVKFDNVPHAFTLKCAFMPPDSILNKSANADKAKYDSEKDLMKSKIVASKDANYGQLYFLLDPKEPHRPNQYSKVEEIKVYCFDIKNKIRISKVDFTYLKQGLHGIYLPKSGISQP